MAFNLRVPRIPFGAAGGRAPGAAGHSSALRGMRGQRSPGRRGTPGAAAPPRTLTEPRLLIYSHS